MATFHEKIKKENKELSSKGKSNLILKLFGNDAARNNFLSLCKEYFEARGIMPESQYGENYQVGVKKYSPPKRAILHNRIMDILGRLVTQSKSIAPAQRDILNEMASRENAYRVIKGYFLAQRNEEDEEESIRNRPEQQGPSYYHTLGKGA